MNVSDEEKAKAFKLEDAEKRKFERIVHMVEKDVVAPQIKWGPRSRAHQKVESIRRSQAARHELRPASQKRLLRAAAFGKVYVPKDVDKHLLPATCARLRVLNAIREPRVGVPATWDQLEALGMPALLRQLLARHEHLLLDSTMERTALLALLILAPPLEIAHDHG